MGLTRWPGRFLFRRAGTWSAEFGRRLLHEFANHLDQTQCWRWCWTARSQLASTPRQSAITRQDDDVIAGRKDGKHSEGTSKETNKKKDTIRHTYSKMQLLLRVDECYRIDGFSCILQIILQQIAWQKLWEGWSCRCRYCLNHPQPGRRPMPWCNLKELQSHIDL